MYFVLHCSRQFRKVDPVSHKTDQILQLSPLFVNIRQLLISDNSIRISLSIYFIIFRCFLLPQFITSLTNTVFAFQ